MPKIFLIKNRLREQQETLQNLQKRYGNANAAQDDDSLQTSEDSSLVGFETGKFGSRICVGKYFMFCVSVPRWNAKYLSTPSLLGSVNCFLCSNLMKNYEVHRGIRAKMGWAEERGSRNNWLGTGRETRLTYRE